MLPIRVNPCVVFGSCRVATMMSNTERKVETKQDVFGIMRMGLVYLFVACDVIMNFSRSHLQTAILVRRIYRWRN